HRLADDVSALGQHATSKQLATLAERSNQLCRKISAWTEGQTLYMPAAAQQRLKYQHADHEGIAPPAFMASVFIQGLTCRSRGPTDVRMEATGGSGL
ncbi:hypothetical protein Hypma_004550, partial [Hypsizygus marmoreus]